MFDHPPPEFNAENARTLKEIDFVLGTPGTIIQDFEMLLEYISETSVSLTKNLQLPMKHFISLNDKMTKPIIHDLKRPAFKSMPNIQGLYLLLRSSGLVLVRGNGKKPCLAIDSDVKNSWDELTPTEKFFCLFESWLFSNSEILGERAGRFDLPVYKWSNFFHRIPDDGLEVLDDDNQIQAIKYRPGLYNVSLMELFGLVLIHCTTPLTGKGWRIKSIFRTRLGEALLALVAPYYLPNDEEIDFLSLLSRYEQPDRSESIGELQSYIQPHIPEWQNMLDIPKHEFRDGLYIFKVYIFKDVWRRIAVAGTSLLDTLCHTILKAFNFDNDHLWRIIFKDRYGIDKNIYHPYMDEGPFTSEIRIGDLPLEPRLSFLFNFDFGDNWYFEVVCEQIDTPPTELHKPKVLETRGDAPEQYPSW
jgi:hypothetical protein